MPPRRARDSPLDHSGDSMSPAAMLAAMQAMPQELAILRQAIHVAPAGAAQVAGALGAGIGGVPGGPVPAGAAPGGGADVPLPVCHTRFQGVEPSAYHMCARIHFHTYVDVTSVIYQKPMQ
jgi:hypothetical protein